MKTSPQNSLVTLAAAIELIESKAPLSIAGPEPLLDRLPRGNWIGGTSSYFSAENGGVKTAEHLFVTFLPDFDEVRVACYDEHSLKDLMRDAPDNGCSFAIIPSGSATLQRFAEESRFWPEIFLKPVVGWVAGIDLASLGSATPKVYNGHDGTIYADAVIVTHISLPPEHIASIETVNIFERDPRAVIRFPRTGFEATSCVINGKPAHLADFLLSHGDPDGKLPLMGDFAGANINVSVQHIDAETGRVRFYAPVFPDVEYYLAQPLENYEARFAEELGKRAQRDVVFSCNCILNYLHGGLEGKRTGALQGPVTFGEIAYLLHNQTLVTLTIS